METTLEFKILSIKSFKVMTDKTYYKGYEGQN